jgi:hypothetical protein
MPEPDRGGRTARVGHLGGDGALPDELVEAELVGAQLARHLRGRAEGVAGGPDRLVRLLRVLGLRRVQPRPLRHELGAVELRGLPAGSAQRLLRQVHGVGTHVGDVAVLVQPLRHPHRLARREAQLAAGLLLQGRRRERGRGLARVGLLLDAPHREARLREPVDEGDRRGLVEVGHTRGTGGRRQRAAVVEVTADRDAGPVDGHQPGGELPSAGLLGRRLREGAGDVPVGRGPEGHALALAFDHEPGRHRLHPPGGQPRSHLPPQHRRHLVAVQAVEDAAGLLGVDETLVEVAGVLQGALDGLAGDLVEDHAPHGHLRLQHLEQVPGDGLALAILVRGEVELVCVPQGALQLADHLLLVGVDDVVGLEAVVDVDGELAERTLLHVRGQLARLREVTDVAAAGLDLELRAEVARDGARLRRRLDDDEPPAGGRLARGHGCRASPGRACSNGRSNRLLNGGAWKGAGATAGALAAARTPHPGAGRGTRRRASTVTPSARPRVHRPQAARRREHSQ